MKKTKSTFSNNFSMINPKEIGEAIKLLEKPKMSGEEINTMIATLAQLKGATVFLSKLLPKGQIFIGDCESTFPKPINILKP